MPVILQTTELNENCTANYLISFSYLLKILTEIEASECQIKRLRRRLFLDKILHNSLISDKFKAFSSVQLGRKLIKSLYCYILVNHGGT